MFAVINTIRKPAQRKVVAAMFAPVFNAQPHNDRSSALLEVTLK